MATSYAIARVDDFQVGFAQCLIALSKAVSPDGDSYFCYAHAQNYSDISYLGNGAVVDSPWSHWLFVSSSTEDALTVVRQAFATSQTFAGTLADGVVSFPGETPPSPQILFPPVTFPTNPSTLNTEVIEFNPGANDYMTTVIAYAWTGASFGQVINVSEFWTQVKDLSVGIDVLWADYGPQMETMGVQALQYRELATKALTGYASGSLVGLSTLDDIASAIIVGTTKGELLANYGGAAIAYGDQIRSFVEGTFLTPAQSKAAAVADFTQLHTLLRQGTKLSSLAGQYGHLLMQNPGGYIMWDQWARTGMYPR